MGNRPIRRVGTVDVVVPVADPELLVEAGVVATHIRDPPTVLVTHVEDLREKKTCGRSAGRSLTFLGNRTIMY